MALEAEEGNLTKAFEWLRKKGIAAAAKKSGRSALEGLVGIKLSNSKGVIVEINSETDFVARNQLFQSFVADAVETAYALPQQAESGLVPVDIHQLLAFQIPGKSGTLGDSQISLVSSMREKIEIRRAAVISIQDGIIAGYAHGTFGPVMGKSAALVSLQVTGDIDTKSDDLAKAGKKLAMHIVAAKPLYKSPENIPADVLQREKSAFMELARTSNKPESVLEKIVQGRLSKFYSEVTLLNQPHMIEDGNPPINVFLGKLSKQLGCQIKIQEFVRIQCGEEECAF